MSLSKNLTHVLNTKKCFLEVKTEPFHQDCVRTNYFAKQHYGLPTSSVGLGQHIVEQANGESGLERRSLALRWIGTHRLTMWVIHIGGDACIAHVVRCLLYMASAPPGRRKRPPPSNHATPAPTDGLASQADLQHAYS